MGPDGSRIMAGCCGFFVVASSVQPCDALVIVLLHSILELYKDQDAYDSVLLVLIVSNVSELI